MRKSLALLLLAAACAPAPAYRAPETVPVPRAPLPSGAPAPASASSAEIGAEIFADSTLSRIIRETVVGNLDLQAAEARVRGARAARFGSTLDFGPTITGSAGYTRRRLPSAQFGGAFTLPDQNLYDAGADLSWEVDLFGRLRQQWQARGALVGAAEEDRRGVQVALAAEVARTYFELRGTQARLRVAEQNAENQRHTLDVVRQRLDAGRGTALDTERAQAQLRTTLARIPLLASAVRTAQWRLDVLAGRPPQSSGALLAPAALPVLPDTIRPGDLDSLVRRRPDVASAERSYAALRAVTGAARREYLPRVAVNGSAGFTSLTLDSLGKSGTSRFSIGPVISWPLLNLGRVRSRVEIAAADEAAAAARYRLAALGARQEIESALLDYQARLRRLADLRAAAKASGSAAELARLRFEGGIANFLQVLDAERTTLDAEDQLALGETEAATALVAVYRAIGGPWTRAP